MDVFPSIESTNNVLVKLVAAFNKVDETIENYSDITSALSRLPVTEDFQWRYKDRADSFFVSLNTLMVVAISSVITASVLFLMHMISDFLKKKG